MSVSLPWKVLKVFTLISCRFNELVMTFQQVDQSLYASMLPIGMYVLLALDKELLLSLKDHLHL